MKQPYWVTAPNVPGAKPCVTVCATLKKARAAARSYAARKDLTHQDITIHHGEKFLGFYGPLR